MQRSEVYELTRKRSPNFTRKENKVLAELIQIYEDQIERKKTDHVSNLEKIRAWQELANDFNARLGGDPYRSFTVLKHRYENIKKDIRRTFRKKRQSSEINQVIPLDVETNNDVDFKEIIRVKLMTEETVDHDDFVGFAEVCNETTSLISEPQPEKYLDEIACTSSHDNLDSNIDWQRNCYLEEHKLRLRQMKEKHNLELELIRQEHREKIKMLRQEHDTKMELLELEKTLGPHSVLADDEFYDAVESGLDKMEEEQELREKLKTGQIPVTPPPTSPAIQHRLWPDIDRIVKQQVTMARMGIGECGTGWQLFAEDGEMKMYRREEEVDGMVVDPLKAVHVVKGITGHEVCHYFFNPKYRYDWETTLEHMTVLENISEDTLLFLQTHKRIWPASQRDVVFWSHIRKLPNDQDRDGPDIWTVVNNSTTSPEHPANAGKCVRIYLTVCLLCQTRVHPPKDGAPITRDNVSCKITYCSVVNPGGWAPASVLRAVYKREYPKFLKRFTAYVINQTKNKPLMF